MNFGRRLKRHLLTGLLVLAPLSISLFLLAWLVGLVDRILLPLLPPAWHGVPGLGLATAAALLVAAGWLASNVIGRHALETIEDLVAFVPLLNWLYRTVKQLTEAFSPAGKAAFRSVVMVEHPREGVYQLGFATGTVSCALDGAPRTLTSVYIPTNHVYMGDVLLVPPERLRPTSMTLQEGIQFFLSAGASTPPELRAGPRKEEGPAA